MIKSSRFFRIWGNVMGGIAVFVTTMVLLGMALLAVGWVRGLIGGVR